MLLAQSTPIATPASVAVPVDHFIIGDLSKVIAKAPDDWSKIIIHAIGFIAVAYLIGWVASKLMRWVSTKFGSSPIAEATVAALGKSLPFILPAYTLLFLIKDFKEALAFIGWLNFAVTSGTFLCSLAHTASIFYLVAIPIAWAQKIADQSDNKLDDILVPMFSTVIRITVILVGTFKAISIIDPKSSDAILGLLAGVGWAVGTLILKRRPVEVPALVLTGWQLLITAVPTTIGAFVLAEGPWFMPSWQSIAVIGWIALVPMAIGNAAWFAIVGMLPSQVAGLSSILVPVVAMISGALLHGEPLGPVQWLAMACSGGALWLALGKR